MTKEIFKISKFHGGESEVSDPRDIEDSELAKASGISVSELGKIKLLGSILSHPASGGAPGNDSTTDNVYKVISAGYNAFSFKSDYNNAEEIDWAYYWEEDSSNAPKPIPEKYIAILKGKQSVVRLYTESSDDWQSSLHDTYCAKTHKGTASHMPKGIFIKAGANIRIIDTNFDNITDDPTNDGANYQVGWLGHIKQKRFPGLTESGSQTTIESDINMLKGTHAEIKSPEQLGYMGVLDWAEASDAFPDEDAPSKANATGIFAGSFHLSVSSNKTESGGWRGFKSYYMTFIYDGVQESLMSPFLNDGATTGSATAGTTLGTDTTFEDSKKSFRLRFRPKDWSQAEVNGSQGYPLNQRITGGRIYFREVNSALQPYGDPIFLFEFDFNKGSKKFLDNEWSAWEYDANDTSGRTVVRTPSGGGASSSNASAGMLVFNSEPSGPTYEALSGISNEETSIHATFKTGVIANNRLYAANIGQVDPSVTRDKNAYTFNGDAMLKSPPLKYDILPSLSKIEVTIGDGDDITALAAHADRLLQFKQDKLHIINISQDFEFLEETLNFKGVNYPGAVCKTDYGIAWMNEFGAFIYDGKEVTDLLEKKGRKLIKPTTWATFAGNTPAIGFDPKTKDLICKGDSSGGYSGEIWVYNLITQGWVTDPDRFNVDLYGELNAALCDSSQFFVDYDGKLTMAGEQKLRYWNSPPGDNHIAFITKDFDFGLPGVKKKIHKVYISYKDGVNDGSGGAGLQIKYLVNGNNDSGTKYQFQTDGGGAADNTPLSDANNVNQWKVAELKPATASEANGIYTFALWFYSSTALDETFEINDISIIYRTKNIK